MVDCREGRTFGSSYQEVRKNEGSRNRGSILTLLFFLGIRYWYLFLFVSFAVFALVN